MKILLFIGAGSFLGGIARYTLTRFVAAGIESELPCGTFTVNVLGCLFLGILYQFFSTYTTVPNEVKLFLTVGFCGGFTTFSTFIGEDFAMLSAARYFLTAAYAAMSVVVGLLAFWLGARLISLFQ